MVDVSGCVVVDVGGATVVDVTLVVGATEVVGVDVVAGVSLAAGAEVSGAVNGITSLLIPEEHAANNAATPTSTAMLVRICLPTGPAMVTYSSRWPSSSRTEVVLEREVEGDRKSTRLNSSHTDISRMPSSA